MKKIVTLLLFAVYISSCYDDYVKDYDQDGVYFTYQTDVRTFVVGEGMLVKVGVPLSGVLVNDRDRSVRFEFDNSLVNDDILQSMKNGDAYIKSAVSSVTALKRLPDGYFTISDNGKIIIPKGEHSGAVIIRPDSVRFLSDPETRFATYVLPFRLTIADADTILESKNYSVVAFKYENMLFGNYWHGGETTEKDANGNTVNVRKYYTSIPSPDSKAWTLTTVSPNSLVTNGVSDQSSLSKPQFQITLNNGNVIISSVVGANYEVQPDGTSSFNQAKLLQDRKIFLNYKYQLTNGNWCYAKDTLTFRNRIRDGVNEWQDLNPSHYE